MTLHMKEANIDWNTLLHTVRQFPHLRQIAIQCKHRYALSIAPTRPILVEFLAHLGEAWFGLDELVGLYYNDEEQSGTGWAQLQLLDTVMDEINERVRCLLSVVCFALC